MTTLTSVRHILEEVERRASPQYCYELFNHRINFYAEDSYLDDVCRFYRPYYHLRQGELVDPSLRVFAGIQGKPERQDPITDMRVYLETSDPDRVEDGVAVFVRPQTGIQVFADRRRSRIYVLGSDPREVNLQLRTLIRDQLFREIEKQNGSIVFHAAAVEKNGLGIAFMGPRNCGKTSSLLSLMFSHQFNVLSFDRIKLRLTTDGIVAAGMASRCNIHRVAINTNPFLQPLLSLNLPFDQEDKTLVEARHLTDLAGTTVSAQARLKLLIFPDIRPEYPRLEWETMDDPRQAKELLVHSLLEGSPLDKHQHWLKFFGAAPQWLGRTGEDIMQRIATSVKTIAIRASYADYVQAIAEKRLPLFAP